jgi:hypothetical protein
MNIGLRARTAILIGIFCIGQACFEPRVRAVPQAGSPLPASNREWTGDDYERVSGALAAGEIELPRFRDPKGATLLKRIASVQNLAPLREQSQPIRARFGEFLKVLPSVNSIMRQYLVAANNGEMVHEELASVLGYVIRVGAIGVELTDELLPTLPRDEKYPVRMEGLKKVRSGMMTAFQGAEVSLSERHVYTPKDLSVILQAMSASLPTAKSTFSPEFSRELKQKLQRHRTSFRSDSDRKAIDAMIRELDAPAPRPARH